MEAEQLSRFSNSLQELEQVIPPSFKEFLRNNENILLILERNPETDKVRVGAKNIQPGSQGHSKGSQAGPNYQAKGGLLPRRRRQGFFRSPGRNRGADREKWISR